MELFEKLKDKASIQLLLRINKSDNMNFDNPKMYLDRRDKARFVFEKYESILRGRILDVGADQGYLRDHLPSTAHYEGIGFSEQPFIKNVNLELDNIPYPDKSFDCVLCLDVLEHVENIHKIFDEVCRVSKKWVIISLPNPWADFWQVLHSGPYSDQKNTKFYGLPLEKEADRHKWFFSSTEAQAFITYRSEKNNFFIYDKYIINQGSDGIPKFDGPLGKIKRVIYLKARNLFFRKDLIFSDLYESTQWYVLKKH